MVAMNALPPVPSVFGPGWRNEWLRRIDATEPWMIPWLEHQREDEYWQHGSVWFGGYESIEAATMIVAGHADGYHNMAFRGFERLRSPKRLLFGPWSHMSPRTSMPGPRIDHVPEMIRWWHRWLRGDDNGVDRESPIVIFVRRSTPPRADLDAYEGEWRFEPAWPPERTVEERRDLASASVRDELDSLRVRGDVGVTSSIWCAADLPFGEPWDQRPDEAFSLVYDWPATDEPFEIMGHPSVELTVTSSAPVAFMSAKLCDVFPDGQSALVTRGIVNLTHRASHAEPEALVPGEPVTVAIELDATSWVWEPGHRVRLDVAGSDFPSSWPPPVAGTLTVDRRASALVLPVIRGASPDPVVPRFHAGSDHAHRPERVIWRTSEDVIRRERRVSIDHGGVRGTGGSGIEYSDRYGGEIVVRWDQPGTAYAFGGTTYELGWPEVRVRTESRGTLRSDAATWFLELELEVQEDGETIARRRWERSLPRDLA
jgi:predicted acyl esterase